MTTPSTIERTAYSIGFAIEDDQSPDLSYLGMIWPRLDAPRGRLGRDCFAVLHRAHSCDIDDGYYHLWGLAPSGYAVPVYGVEERRRDLSRLGYSKSNAEVMARARVRQDVERLLSHGIQWGTVGIIATLRTANGTEVSTASVWGVESDSDQSHFEELARELAAELEAGLPEILKSRVTDCLDSIRHSVAVLAEVRS